MLNYEIDVTERYLNRKISTTSNLLLDTIIRGVCQREREKLTENAQV